MFASIGLPGLSGFAGEFLVALGTWHYNPVLAAITFSVVIFAAWYMMYMTQRVVWGRPKGVLPDPHDGALTPTEVALLASHDHGHGHGHAVPSISGASQEHHDEHGHGPGAESEVPGEERQMWPDLTRKELLTLLPLVVLTIYVGVYPQSVLNICEPALQRILDMVVR
jgi:NADH-quinone oxidoreductase subunit M